METIDLAIIGGGAAGYFAAANAAEMSEGLRIVIFEKSAKVLSKVLVSGGGRCNVTHACFEPKELITYYPRGGRELLGPFHHFQPGDTMAWFSERGVELKIEDDNRVFPKSDRSSSIANCLRDSTEKAGIKTITGFGLSDIRLPSFPGGNWRLTFNDSIQVEARNVLIATGSSNGIWNLIRERTDHSIVPPVPSLFTFQLNDRSLSELSGISLPHVFLRIAQTDLEASGPVLITHRGLSGPAVLRLSAWGARILADMGYRFTLVVNWILSDEPGAREVLREFSRKEGKKLVKSGNPWGLANNLWRYFCSGLDDSLRWADIRAEALDRLAQRCAALELEVVGKNTFKEEFVTAGGIDLKEVDFRTMESKLHKGLYFAGEVLDIDAITGGFNFQAAWTGGWLAARAIAECENG